MQTETKTTHGLETSVEFHWNHLHVTTDGGTQYTLEKTKDKRRVDRMADLLRAELGIQDNTDPADQQEADTDSAEIKW